MANERRHLEQRANSAWDALRKEERRLEQLHQAGAWWEFEAQAARVTAARKRHETCEAELQAEIDKAYGVYAKVAR